jgi:hypothetical protein
MQLRIFFGLARHFLLVVNLFFLGGGGGLKSRTQIDGI